MKLIARERPVMFGLTVIFIPAGANYRAFIEIYFPTEEFGLFTAEGVDSARAYLWGEKR
jgi:hypothetical protein